MARPLVPDDLWAAIEPLLPPARPKPKGGRPPIPDRAALAGIVFVLKTGIRGRTCRRDGLRVGHVLLAPACATGQAAGVWAALHRALLERI
jgi:transposase